MTFHNFNFWQTFLKIIYITAMIPIYPTTVNSIKISVHVYCCDLTAMGACSCQILPESCNFYIVLRRIYEI